MTYLIALFALSLVAGATAGIVGFGIGSLLTPFLALRVGTSVAIAAVSIPHAVATALRCYRLRAAIRFDILKRFGLVSALGALVGVAMYSRLSNALLTVVLGALLVITAVANITGWIERLHPRAAAVPLFGFASGLFGGVAGNQGGLRVAALTAFALTPAAFVATSTATGLLVDAARTPVYLATNGAALRELLTPISVATIGSVAGTLLGERLLFGLAPVTYRRIVAVAVGILGAWLIWTAA